MWYVLTDAFTIALTNASIYSSRTAPTVALTFFSIFTSTFAPSDALAHALTVAVIIALTFLCSLQL